MKFNKKILIPLLSLVAIIIAGVVFFNRTPMRTIPAEGIVSPASGLVIATDSWPSADILFEKKGVPNHVTIPELSGPVKTIIIEMNLGDVHVQRAPLDGTITRMTHYDGNHKNALGSEKQQLAIENEKVVTVFKGATKTIGVVQVAGMAARRIDNWSIAGDLVQKGQAYGRIILGSQVVVILPATSDISVQPGTRVIDGETIIAK